MNNKTFNFAFVHPSWQPIIAAALKTMPADYLQNLIASTDWLPGHQFIFNAFSIPIDKVNYVLFGETPYPRKVSANGYAFWDAAVTNLWSETGLSKAVNRATSLRNFIKMLLITEKLLAKNHTSQADIAAIDKSNLIQTNNELFGSLLNHGFLLLNASLVLQSHAKSIDAKAFYPFIKHIIDTLIEIRPNVSYLLFGQIAKELNPCFAGEKVRTLIAEHPYNLSFINNPEILSFFQPLRLLRVNP